MYVVHCAVSYIVVCCSFASVPLDLVFLDACCCFFSTHTRARASFCIDDNWSRCFGVKNYGGLCIFTHKFTVILCQCSMAHSSSWKGNCRWQCYSFHHYNHGHPRQDHFLAVSVSVEKGNAIRRNVRGQSRWRASFLSLSLALSLRDVFVTLHSISKHILIIFTAMLRKIPKISLFLPSNVYYLILSFSFTAAADYMARFDHRARKSWSNEGNAKWAIAMLNVWTVKMCIGISWKFANCCLFCSFCAHFNFDTIQWNAECGNRHNCTKLCKLLQPMIQKYKWTYLHFQVMKMKREIRGNFQCAALERRAQQRPKKRNKNPTKKKRDRKKA